MSNEEILEYFDEEAEDNASLHFHEVNQSGNSF